MLTRDQLKLPKLFNGNGMHYHTDGQPDTPEGMTYHERYFQMMSNWGITSLTVRKATPYFYLLATKYGMLVVNRTYRRAYQPFSNDGNPVQTAHDAGHAAIIQINNEDELLEEWDGQPVNWEVSAKLLIDASCQVYDQGGIVAWQMLDFKYFRYCVQVARDNDAMRIFDRWMFVPHNYGINHPPDYVQDESAFLGFRFWADVINAELGFIPLMISGECGWGLGEDADNRYPKVSDDLRVQYEMSVYESFRTGILPDGQPLPDYYLAANIWILAATLDGGQLRWEDDAVLKGNGLRRDNFIQAMIMQPTFTRRFTDMSNTLADSYPEAFKAWIDAGGDAEEAFRFYLMATGRMPATVDSYRMLASRMRSHLSELEAIGLMLPKE